MQTITSENEIARVSCLRGSDKLFLCSNDIRITLVVERVENVSKVLFIIRYKGSSAWVKVESKVSAKQFSDSLITNTRKNFFCQVWLNLQSKAWKAISFVAIIYRISLTELELVHKFPWGRLKHSIAADMKNQWANMLLEYKIKCLSILPSSSPK